MATANTYLRVTDLDFNEIKTNLKSYLAADDKFKDFNFEGSVMSNMLDVLAYNTHYNAYYVNMLSNEMFLDTAQQRDSVVSRAKELGYVPASSVGSKADINLVFNGIPAETKNFTINKNSKFSTIVDDVNYTYVTPEAIVVESDNGAFSKTVTLKEGELLTHQFVNDGSRFIIPNKNVDISSIVVKVQTSASETTKSEYSRATNIRQVYSTSEIYFLEEAFDEKYEIIFGSGALGKSLITGNIVIVEYLVCNGTMTNGASEFSIDDLNITTTYTSVDVTPVSSAHGGRFREDVESIKFNAPRSYQTQNRAIISNDYERILLAENADLQSVVAYGGENADPQVYGKVYIAIKPYGEELITANRKDDIKESLMDRTPLGIDPVIIDPDYIHIIPEITTYYDKTRTTATPSTIEQSVRDAVEEFSFKYLGRFGDRLRYSRFVRHIDNVPSGHILNNDAIIKLEKRFVPNLNILEKYTLNFNNAIRSNELISTAFT